MLNVFRNAVILTKIKGVNMYKYIFGGIWGAILGTILRSFGICEMLGVWQYWVLLIVPIVAVCIAYDYRK